MSDVCHVDASDPQISRVTLNRPEKRNALSIELIEQLTAAVRSAEADRERRVLVFCGNGPVFCAGLDLAEASDPSRSEHSAHALAEFYAVVCESPLVTIASAQGAAFGGGVGLLAGCDLVVAADDLRIGFPEVHRGLTAALVTCLVRRQVGERTLRELILLGQSIDATRAVSIGLANRTAAAAQLHEVTLSLARDVCRGAPGAIVRTKRLLDELSPRPIRDDLRLALNYHLQARDSAEAAEGVSAFLQKRTPRWGPRPEGS